jgi:hypothetical protein
MLVLLAGLAGCGDVKTDWACGEQDPPPPEVTVLRVKQRWLNEEGDRASVWSGTGFPISTNGLISFRHELPSNVEHVYVEGELAPVLDRGNKETIWDDWVHVRFQSAPDRIPTLDPKVELHPGERVAMVGFSTHGIPKHRLNKLRREGIPARALYGKVAFHPSYFDLPEEVVLINAGNVTPHGLSGGPVMVLRDNKWVVVGIMVTEGEHRILRGLFSYRLLVARRLPEHLLEK